MRLVLDTNVVVAGLLWVGHPRHLLDLAISGDVALFGSPALIDELAHTLNYPKFSQRIAAHCAATPSALTVRYSALVTLVTPSEVPRVIEQDADDDQVLACAVAAKIGARVGLISRAPTASAAKSAASLALHRHASELPISLLLAPSYQRRLVEYHRHGEPYWHSVWPSMRPGAASRRLAGAGSFPR
ncbi:MAG: putative toxin-antitoxin system toxin component, PIN family [Rhodocyclales bacterium GWA2_65_19]|nr:MAG: putative toxin-antitoxin system toxin component, PIN family [Rhodocyclales bacterium GWA2_65_19]